MLNVNVNVLVFVAVVLVEGGNVIDEDLPAGLEGAKDLSEGRLEIRRVGQGLHVVYGVEHLVAEGEGGVKVAHRKV